MSLVGDLSHLVASSATIVCCGSGGAGKTTTSAAIGLAAARLGRSACVVTIDPARRLADALGLEELGNEPVEVEGEFEGRLFALMLDAKATFDGLVRSYSQGEEQAERILSNRLYANLTSALAGTQEYMASEKLYELTSSGRFDVVIVDTPPSRSALDFLDAPARLGRFLNNRVFRLLLLPRRSGRHPISVASRAIVATISKVAGSEIVDDAVSFFGAFEGMEDGFKERAKKVEELLSDASTAFVLVAAPRPDSLEEARYFSSRLATSGLAVAALVVNRLHPLSYESPLVRLDGEELPPGLAAQRLGLLRENLAELEALARAERVTVEEVYGADEQLVVEVPFLASDVHDLAGLGGVAGHLMGQLASTT